MRTALITGANRGIGLAIAAGLNRIDGIKVLAGSRHAYDGENLAKVLAGNAVAVQLDLSTSESCRRQVEHIVDVHGGIDILVNNGASLCKRPVTRP